MYVLRSGSAVRLRQTRRVGPWPPATPSRKSHAARTLPLPRASNGYLDATSVARHQTSELTRLNTNALGGRRAAESRRFDFTSVERRRGSQSATARHAWSDGGARVGRTHVLSSQPPISRSALARVALARQRAGRVL